MQQASLETRCLECWNASDKPADLVKICSEKFPECFDDALKHMSYFEKSRQIAELVAIKKAETRIEKLLALEKKHRKNIDKQLALEQEHRRSIDMHLALMQQHRKTIDEQLALEQEHRNNIECARQEERELEEQRKKHMAEIERLEGFEA